MAVNKDMRGLFQFLMPLFATIQLVHAEPTPRVDLPENDTLDRSSAALLGNCLSLASNVAKEIKFSSPSGLMMILLA
jgi:hypothetical protein